MSTPTNTDPFQPWNDPMYSRDPLAPHNDPMYRDDITKPWNDLFGDSDDLTHDEKQYYGLESNDDELDEEDY